MIVCPNCNHQNPSGATQCEACYTPLPVTTTCPNCGATVQEDASFCGQCGFNLEQEGTTPAGNAEAGAPDPLPSTFITAGSLSEQEPNMAPPDTEEPPPTPPSIPTVASSEESISLEKEPLSSPPPTPSPSSPPSSPPPTPPVAAAPGATQLQVEQANLLHIQTDSILELPGHLSVIHIGKPGGAVPPDIDVSGFPDSAVVSRVHADIRVEGGIYYLEDVGSSNGTYINHVPLPVGNRHRLRAGDRIALGKEDKVTFIFQMS
ncbi:MAG: FHA domain-containing protein [Cyanobacteriota bacterium]|nr:FHA domain-containing protein [Cyanobacteriota bacterium]